MTTNRNEIKQKIKDSINFEGKFREYYPELYQSTGNSFSPFRDETAPSFQCNKDFGYDHGSGENYDIFSLYEHRFNCNFQKAFDVLRAEAGIFDPPKKSRAAVARKEIVAYDYVNETGQLLYQNIRYEPKDFRARRPDPDKPGEWIWDLKGIKRVPFKLTELLAAPKDQPVFVCEGEKDASAMIDLGFVATSVGSASTGCRTLEKHGAVNYFKGRDIIIVADKDDNGRKYAQKAAPICAKMAQSVKIIEMPGEGIKDPADFYETHGAAGSTIIESIVEATTQFTPQTGNSVKGSGDQTAEVTKPATNKKRKEKVLSEQAVELLQNDYDLQGWKTTEGDKWVTVKYDGHYCFYNTKGDPFKSFLRNANRKRYGVTLKSNSCKDALDDIESICEMSYEIHKIHVRFFYEKGKAALDLCDAGWNQIEITSADWEIRPQTEPRFKRVAETLPLPKPEYSPTAIDDFLNVLTVTNKTHRLLIKCWLIVACIENIPRPILLLNGAPGGAKSGLATAIRETIDPNVLDRMMPNWDDLRTLKIALGHCGIVTLENQSGLKTRAVNLLCGVATGAVLVDRTLFLNDELSVMRIKKPVIMTSIAPSSIQPDFLDRCLIINRERIRPEESKTEEEVNSSLEELRPKVLHWICDTLVKTIRIKESGLKIAKPTRMHDFALWAEAASRAMGNSENAFLEAYQENIKNVSQSIALDTPLVFLMKDLLNEREEAWTGTGTALLNELRRLQDTKGYDKSDLPKSSSSLSRQVTNLSAALRNHGIIVEFKETNQGRVWTIRYYNETTKPELASDKTETPQNVLPFEKLQNIAYLCTECEFNGGKRGCKYDPSDATPIRERKVCPKDNRSLTQSM